MSVNEIENRNEGEEYEMAADEKQEDVAVPEEEPDLIGRWVLRGKKLVAFLLRPLWKGLSLFLAPLWKPFRKNADKITRKEWVLFSGMLLAVILIVGTPIVWMRIKNTHREEGKLYSFFHGERTYWEDIKFEIDEANHVELTDSEGKKVDVSGLPFYYTDQDVMFWPFYGIWYPVDDLRCARIDRFSQIKYEHGTGCSIQVPDGHNEILPGFLYDNEDTYVFFENVKLSYNGQSREMVPFSYVRVYGNNNMELYYYGEEKGEFVFLESDPEVQFSNGAKIDLKGDVMKYPNGVQRLLFVTVEYIKPLGSE